MHLKLNMDLSLLIEVHQYYINSLKQKNQEKEKSEMKPNIVHYVPSVPNVTQTNTSVLAKTVTLEIARVLCMHGNVKIYDITGNDITHTAQEQKLITPENTPENTLSKIRYDFPNQVNVQRIVITRPSCTNMVNSKIKITDSNNACLYESTPVTETQSLCHTYTYTIPNLVPSVL